MSVTAARCENEAGGKNHDLHVSSPPSLGPYRHVDVFDAERCQSFTRTTGNGYLASVSISAGRAALSARRNSVDASPYARRLNPNNATPECPSLSFKVV